MACPVNLHVEGTTSIKSLADYCGTNIKMLTQIIGVVTKGLNENGVYVASEEFDEFCKEQYGKTFDLNGENSSEVRDAMIECYKDNVPSARDSIRDDKASSMLRVYGYTSASARDDGKRVITSRILTEHINDLFRLDPKSDDGKRRLLARARSIAFNIVNNSKLEKPVKDSIKAGLSKTTSVAEIRQQLAAHDLKSNFDVYGKNVEYYKYIAKRAIEEEIVNRIALQSGEDVGSIRQNLYKVVEDEKGKKQRCVNMLYCEKALGDNNMSLQDRNVLATFVELTENTNDYFEELTRNSKLEFLRNDRKDEFDNENEKEAENAIADEDEGDETGNESIADDEVSLTIGMYDHSGTFTSAMTHVNRDIKAFLDSIPLLNSTEKVGTEPDYDLDNGLGMSVTMDANKAATVLYHYCNTNSVEDFVESIRQISESLPGFAGFSALADFLTRNKTAAFAFYTNFGKKVISKVQLNQEKDVRTFEITNKKSNKIDALRQELFNTIRTSIPRQDVEYNSELVKDIETFMTNNGNNIKKNSEGKLAKGAIERICKILKHYYPTIEDYSIENYIYKNKNSKGVIDVVGNINSLIGIAKRTIKESERSQEEYKKMLDRMSDARSRNKALREEKRRRLDAEQSIKDLPEEEDVISIYSKDYMTPEQLQIAIDLSNMIVDHALVKVENNSLNPLGNQSSDVINSSFLTGMMQVLQDRVLLGKYGEFKFKSSQYNFSNILLEHRDEDGKIVSYGLFTKNADGSVSPTDYAKELLSISLYNGARNYDEEKGITYPNHSKGDYLVTQFAAFNQNEKREYKGIQFAGYMTRTPSDAPKNFVIYAPRYSAAGLFITKNAQEVNKRRQEIKNSIFSKNFTGNIKEFGVNKTPIKTQRIDSIVNHITRDGNNISLPEWSTRGLEEGKEYTIKFQYNPENDTNEQNIYLVKGIYKDGTLINTEFAGIYNGSLSDDVNDYLNFAIETQLEKEGIKERGINSKHVLVKQLRNMFKQELLDMAVALDKFFITENGLILRYTKDDVARLAKDGITVKEGDIIWKDGISHNGREVDGAYDNYHHKKGKIIEGEIGQEKLLGNVFHSDKFTVFDENDNEVRNYGDELIYELFNPLYGGSDASYLSVQRNEDGVIEDVILTEDINDKIDAKLTEFVNVLVNDAYDRLHNFEDIIGKRNLTYEKIADFVINYHLFYNNSNDLFEGDSKFYKSAQDFLKRAKEIQGSGVPYGIANFANAFNSGREIIPSPLASTMFHGGKRVQQYNKFVGVTVVNTTTANQKTLETLVKQLVKNGVDKKQAEALMKGFGYKNPKKETTVNDAQSYITFDEWIRRITARGQLNKYKDLINKVLSGEELNGSELTEFIQVQKNFYYDQNYDEVSNIFAPRQIKNAEFVLIPQLIKGTQLEVVAKLMEKYKIDQLNTEETSKAGKTNVLSIFDEKTGEVHQDIIDEMNDGDISKFGQAIGEDGSRTQLYGYEFLYTQQETPQHVDAENKAGIQIMKKIIDNINPEDKELYEYKKQFIEAYSANIRESAQNLFKELNLDVDKNGNPKVKYNERGEAVIKGLKYSVFYDKLKSELFRLGYDSNMIDYVTLDAIQQDENGNVTLMPNYMSMVGQKLENIAQSVFNHSITRQKLPGFHAAQITNVGWKATKDKVSYSNELRYHTDEKGNYVDYIEVMLPASAFHFKRRNADGSLKSKEQLLKELQDEGLDFVIGYRIPTEGKQSVCKMKVVGFIDDGYGSTIVVPNEWVAQTGSDFDIDSVYGIQHSTYIDKDGIIRKHKDGDNRNVRNNTIVDSMLNILSHPKSLEENLSRSNFDDITDNRDDIYDEIEKAQEGLDRKNPIASIAKRRQNRSVYNVLDQADYQEDAMSGYKLKGFSVTRDNFCSVCNTVHPTVSDQYAMSVTYSTDVISYEDAVKRFGKENVTKKNPDEIIIKHNRFGWSLDKKNVVGKILTAYSSQTTAHILDAIKEGFIPNVNDFTFGVYKLFPDLGIDYKTAIAFMMQNGVSRIVNAYNNTKSIYANDTQKPVSQAIRQIAKELGMPIKDWTSPKTIIAEINKKHSETIKRVLGVDSLSLDDNNIGNIEINSEKYIANLSTPLERIDSLIFDLGVILQYNKFKHFADEIGNLARVCNPDKFGAKQTIYATSKVFDDIKEMVDSDRPQALTVDGKAFLKAIYPDVEKGVEGYLSSNNNDSKYPILHTFLKYSTAPSILINRSLFRTQSEEFRTYVKNLEKFLSNGSKLTEAQAKAFEKYLISDLYSQCDTLTMPITFIKKNKRDVWKSLIPKDIPADQLDEVIRQYKEEEKARIFGFRTTPEPMMIIKKNGKEEVVPFEIKDIAHPSQKDIDNFAILTPAQKVAFIQENFRDAGIFSSLLVNLFNVRDISGKKAGSQTIEFIEDTISKEDAYIQFVEAFTNRNPLIALAAYDLVKYAFVVEGYKMSKRGISKIVPNSVLYNDHGISGTGLVTELNGRFTKLENDLRYKEKDAYIDFVRSHSKTLNIPFKYVTKTGKTSYELIRTNGMILIPFSEENNTLLGKYKITYTKGANSEQYFNEFVRLKFGKDEETLYKIVKKDNGVVLYPLNLLEENEHGEFSSNSAHWKYASRQYYENIINDLGKSSDIVFDTQSIKIIASNYKIDEYKHKANAVTSERYGSIDFDMEEGGADHLKDEAQRFYSSISNQGKVMYIMDTFLERHIKRYGKAAGLVKYITIKHGEGETAEFENLPIKIYKLKPKEVYNSIQTYLGNDKPIDKKHQKYTYIIETLRSRNIKKVAEATKAERDGVPYTKYETIIDIFAIDPNIFTTVPTTVGTEEQKTSPLRKSRLTEGRNATATDVAGDIYKSVSRVIAADTADAETLKIRQYWRDKSITFDKTSIEDNLFDIIRSGSEYVTKRVESITNQLKYFMEDPNGDGYLAVNDPAVMEAIYNNPELRNRLLQLILEAEALVTNNMSVLELDIKSQDPALQNYLNKIKNRLQELQNSNLIAEAQNLFANEYLKNYSTNPLIKRDLLNVLNGFYSTNWLESWIGDLQETPNPMIQIIAKEVTSDLFAKQKLAQQRVVDFENTLASFAKEASAAGKSFSLSHIIDKNGRFIQDYVQKLVEDRDKLQKKCIEAREAYNNGEGDYKTYLEAKLEYDKWKLAHIHQELDDDYYRRKIALDDAMLHGTKPSKQEIALGADPQGSPGYPDAFVKYKELEAKRRELYSHTVNGYLDPYYLEELDKVSAEISRLIDEFYVDPLDNKTKKNREEYDPFFNPLTGTEEQKRIKKMYSGPAQRALRKYINDMKELNDEYYQRTSEFGFEEELNNNIHIITSYEKRDANGNITVPMNLLMEHPDYVAAKEWIAHNAKFVMNDENKDELNKAREVLRKKNSRVKLNKAVKTHDAKDIYGNIDATKFTEEEIEAIKSEQTSDQNYHDSGSFSDRTLVKNASPSTIIYKREFYSGLTTGGASNLEYFAKVKEINSILERYWDNNTKTIRFDLIPDTDEGRALLRKLGTLYTQLLDTKKREGASKEDIKKAIKFREENVDTSLSEEEMKEFEKQKALAYSHPGGENGLYAQAWNDANYIIIDGERVPNYYIYGSLKPKAEVADKWIDKEKTNALNLLNQTYMTVPTQYYYQKVDEMSKKGKEAFTKWYYDNHIFNPSTRSYEPIRCWTTYQYRDTSSAKGEWVPLWMNTRSEIRPEKKNKEYIPNVGHAMNYKKGTGYDNPEIANQNEFEKKAKTYIQDLLYSLVHTDSGLAYLNKGYLPSQGKAPDVDAKFIGKEFLKALGWVTYHNGKERFHEDVGYDTDRTVNMPMLTLLNQKSPKDLGITKPIKQQGESNEDFAKREAKYEEDIKKLNEENAKAHQAALNDDWKEVIKSFILQASNFNAIQDNKYMLFYGKRMLQKLETYITKYGGTSDFQTDSINSTEENPEYKSRKEDHLLKQYENWVRRLVYDEWKEPRNQLTKWASRLQSLTSAQYMMMNIRGGIANVTLGETQIIAEAFAKEYFGGKAWAKGIGLWNSSIVSQFASMNTDTSTSLAAAIIKWFNVVDYDENTGRSRIVENPTMAGFNKFNRLMYSPQTIGENFMQNGALFAMLYDHHVYIEEDPVTHQQTVKFKNLEEAIRDADNQALREVLTDELRDKFDKMIEDAKADANKMKDYAWYKKDFANEFAKHYLTNEQRREYIARKKDRINEAKKIHNMQPTMMDQLELKDGYMSIKADSILGKPEFNSTENNSVSEALKLLADFRGRVISVNKKIHGVYDKLGQAQLEKKWYGSLVMQYHKHIYPGMLKRWRVKGMYNEQRGTIEKGSYISLLHFLATPIDKFKQAKSLSEGEREALKGIQNIFREIFDFCTHIGMYWNILPEYEKANIRRNLGDLVGVVSAILMVMALRAAGDDDNKESIWYNLALYEADRLASESFQFNPYGAYVEGKKLWSTPIAAQTGLEDLISTMGFISDWLFDEDFDPNYQSGRFAGENKFIVRLKRRIPIYRGISTSFLEITESNHYYKMGHNVLNSQIVENMIEWVVDDEDEE